VISGMSDDVGTLLVVGHDPTMSETVAALTDTGVSLPTAAVAVISLPGAWADIAGGTGSLVRVRSPKD
jgi:phosphohistidine phosphatase